MYACREHLLDSYKKELMFVITDERLEGNNNNYYGSNIVPAFICYDKNFPLNTLIWD